MNHDPKELFASTAAFYARYRGGYPAALFEHLAERLGLDGTQTALDLGCGTGELARPLAPLVGATIAVDPQPEMLAWGRLRAAEEGRDGIAWRVGDSTSLGSLGLPELDLVTMGASFHWMDRDAVLGLLDGLVAPGGAVVVVGGGNPSEAAPAPPWAAAVAEVRERFLGPERRAGGGTYEHPADDHATVLARSPFSVLESATWTRTVERDVASAIGLQLSYSFSAPALLGDRLVAFVDELATALLDLDPGGRFEEQQTTEAILARRPVA